MANDSSRKLLEPILRSRPCAETKLFLSFPEMETLRRKLTKANTRVSTLETKLQESVASVSYHKVLQQKADTEDQLEQVGDTVPISILVHLSGVG